MLEAIYLGFDFGLKRIGVAVGQKLTGSASPLPTLQAKNGQPDWGIVQKLLDSWHPVALIVGLPTTIGGKQLYTTKASKKFAAELSNRYKLPVHLVDERLSTVEARSQVFARGGWKKLQQTAIDGVAACIILEQWLNSSSE